MEMGGELRARKVDHNCFISGTMQVKRGYYYYLDRAFDIKKGEFRFENTPGINPNITLHSETTIKYRTTTSEEKLEENSCIVNLDVTGKLQKPEINLWSEPSLPEQDIVLLLSLNRPLSGLGSLQQLTPTIPSRALDYFIRTALLSSIEKTIGVDALYLQTDVLGEKRKAKVTVGKYISKDLYVSYTRDLFATSREAFRTEYRLSPRSRIVGERTEEGKSNVNFEVEFRY
jgi:translocation and assembly module TamB